MENSGAHARYGSSRIINWPDCYRRYSRWSPSRYSGLDWIIANDFIQITSRIIARVWFMEARNNAISDNWLTRTLLKSIYILMWNLPPSDPDLLVLQSRVYRGWKSGGKSIYEFPNVNKQWKSSGKSWCPAVSLDRSGPSVFRWRWINAIGNVFKPTSAIVF